ncbi:MAG: tyrosine-type recombinase/integrase, partial [Candidatus Paceibacterota bacterium]
SAKQYTELELRQSISSRNAIANGKSEVNLKTGLKKIAHLAGIEENVSFHVSRHSFAQYAVEQGLDVYELMQTLRHSKIETTQQYLKGLDEELADKAMRKVF